MKVLNYSSENLNLLSNQSRPNKGSFFSLDNLINLASYRFSRYKLESKLIEKIAFNTINILEQEALLKLNQLKEWPDNWNEYGALKPNINNIKLCEEFLKCLFSFSKSSEINIGIPNITADSEGRIVLEWWSKEKKITFYISKDEIFYLKVKSPNIKEMEDGAIPSSFTKTIYENLFSWLYLS